ncbi:MAG: FxLYD domain-containing protein [Candidatus Spyradocola sp.]
MKCSLFKKIAAFLIALALAMTLCACSLALEPKPAEETPPTATEQPTGMETPVAESMMQATKAPTSSDPQYEVGTAQVRLWTNSIGTQWMQTIIPVTNTGDRNLYVDGGSFDIESADGSLIGVQDYVSAYPQILAPGETGYIYENTSMDTPLDETPTILPHPNIDAATVDLIRYEVTDLGISDKEYGGIHVFGRVTNTSDAAASLVYIAVALYDADGNVVDIVFTILTDELAAGAQIGFDASSFSLPNDITADIIADYEVWAYPMQMQLS